MKGFLPDRERVIRRFHFEEVTHKSRLLYLDTFKSRNVTESGTEEAYGKPEGGF